MSDANAINTIEVFGRRLHEEVENLESENAPKTEVVSDLEQELREIGIKNATVSSH